jgi:hypothetical protein
VILPLERHDLFSLHKPFITDFVVLAIPKGQLQILQFKEMRK